MRSVFVCCLYSSRAAANVERKLSVLDVGIVWAGHSDKAVKNVEEHRPSLRRTCVNRFEHVLGLLPQASMAVAYTKERT